MSFIPLVDMPERLRALLNYARPTAAPSGWYKVSNSDGGDDGVATVMVYADIGGFFGIDASDFAEELNAITAAKIMVRLNSPGGAVDQGIAIANLIRSHSAYVTVSIDGLAASIASVIAMAGDEIIAQPNSQMMIHESFGYTLGSKKDHRQMGDILERQDVNIARAYAARAGGRYDSWLRRMEAETWYTAEEAVAAGLADRVAQYPKRTGPDEGEPAAEPDEEDEDIPAAARKAAAKWDLSIFRFQGRQDPKAPDPLADPPPVEQTGGPVSGVVATLPGENGPPVHLTPIGAAPPAAGDRTTHLVLNSAGTGAVDSDAIRDIMRGELRAAGLGIVATAVGSHSTGLEEGTWDAGVNEKRLPSPIPLATVRKVYGWYDESQVEDGALPKSAAKLPHHFVSEDGTPGAASAAGCRNALARLPQTQGLSDAERETVRAHLRGHLGTGDDDSEDRAETPEAEPETEPAETTDAATPPAARLIAEIAAYVEANPDDEAVRAYLAALRPAAPGAPSAPEPEPHDDADADPAAVGEDSPAAATPIQLAFGRTDTPRTLAFGRGGNT